MIKRSLNTVFHDKKRRFSILAAVIALSVTLAGCGGGNQPENRNTEAVTSAVSESDVSVAVTPPMGNEADETEEAITVYTGRAVENEADLAIFKITGTPPEGYELAHDDKDGKLYLSGKGSIMIKAQNYKEEFQALEIFADSGCASLKLNNMLYQADSEFSEPMKTTVAGFDAIRYDYHVTAYEFKYELGDDGEPLKDEKGKRIVKSKDVMDEYDNRVYFFYSDEDAFYILCEALVSDYPGAGQAFDSFIESVTVSKK